MSEKIPETPKKKRRPRRPQAHVQIPEEVQEMAVHLQHSMLAASWSETVRRCVQICDYLRKQKDKGHRILIDNGERMYELVLL